jgi:hypothetical protein
MNTKIAAAHGVIAQIALYGLLSAACTDSILGNGETVSEQREVSAFERLELRGAVNVTVEEAEQPSVVVTIDSNLLDNVITRVDGTTLIVDETYSLLPSRGTRVRVAAPVLTHFSVLGPGDLLATIDQPEATLNVEVSGPGDVKLNGAIGTLHLKVEGPGDVEARGLAAESADISVSGPGDVEATVLGNVAVVVDGPGDVDIYGGATVTRRSRSGPGSIRIH